MVRRGNVSLSKNGKGPGGKHLGYPSEPEAEENAALDPSVHSPGSIRARLGGSYRAAVEQLLER